MIYLETETYSAASRLAADRIAELVTQKPDCVLGLATGSTPVGAYENLIRRHEEGLDFSRITTFNLDEYVGVPKSDPNSYDFFMRKNLFDGIGLSAASTHIPDGMAADPEAECLRYEAALAAAGDMDLQLLGLGLNGHIGFNEPGTPLDSQTHCTPLTASTRTANARFFASLDAVPTQALTMGLGTILRAKAVLLVVCGESKRAILDAALSGPVTPDVPASVLQRHPSLTVIYTPEAPHSSK